MPRVKQSKPKHIPSETTSTDPVVAAVEPAVFAAGVPDAAEPAAAGEAKPKPKKTRVPKVKPCQRCEERRARERQYAKSSRLRQRLATSSAPPTTPAGAAAATDGGAEAAAAADGSEAAAAAAPVA